MTPRTAALFLYLLIVFVPATNGSVPPFGESDHEKWVASSLKEMQSIKVGMKRSDLESVFETEGGLAQATHRTYVYKRCPYFKVDVDFSHNDSLGAGSENDRISSISTPYLAWPRGD
jgi:hypothetical protein